MTDKPPRPPFEDQRIFGPAPERLQAEADEAKRGFGRASLAYGDALVALGNAHLTHGSPATEAARAFEEALSVYALVPADDARLADAHHRLALVLRRLGQYEEATEYLAKAIEILEGKESADGEALQRLKQDLQELRTMHKSHHERKLPPF